MFSAISCHLLNALPVPMSDQVAPKCYIFTRKTKILGGRKMIGFWIGFSMIFGSILERFLDRCWKGFGKVFETFLDITFIFFHMTLHIVLEGN